MTSKQSLRVAELDFDTIKSNLKKFLQAQTEFTDYDFEGSGLSVLIDLLSYNTHYNAVIANMLLQEMYLDTAVKRESLSLISKRLGYTPRGYRAAKAKVNVTIYPDPAISNIPTVAYIYKNTPFSAYINEKTKLTFFTHDSYVAKLIDNKYIFDDVEIHEGSLNTYKYTVTTNNQRYEIPHTNVDTLSIKVFVQTSNSSTEIEEFKEYTTVVDVGSSDSAFYVKLNENLRYEIYFGDGIIGKKPSPGNIIIIEYATTNGKIGNGISDFTYVNSIDNSLNIITTTLLPSIGGNDPETLDEIRYNAQMSVSVQNRAVTEKDYINIISNLLAVDSINVYGGETIVPPAYGKVFVCIKQSGTELPLTSSQKSLIIKEIKKYSVLTLTHEIIDPEYVNIGLNCQIRYDSDKTALSANTLRTHIFDAISKYTIDNFNRFDSEFQYSRFVSYIDNIDPCIISNTTRINLHKGKLIQLDVYTRYEYSFYSKIRASNSNEMNITSSPFKIARYPEYDAFISDINGIIYMYRMINGEKEIIDANIGSVDYFTGTIDFSVQIAASITDDLEIYVIPVEMNIKLKQNNILVSNDTDFVITLDMI